MFHFFESSVIREHETMIDKTAQLWQRRGAGKSRMTNVRWYLYRIIIAMLKLLDIGIAKWNEDEKIFAQLQMLHHCIIAALQMAGAADWTELSLSFIENKRTPRNERYCKARCNSPERENTNVRIILFKISTGGTKGTRLLVIRSGVRRKFVSSSQMFTAPLSRPPAKLIPIIVPGDRLGWRPVPWCHTFQEETRVSQWGDDARPTGQPEAGDGERGSFDRETVYYVNIKNPSDSVSYVCQTILCSYLHERSLSRSCNTKSVSGKSSLK